MDCAREGTAAQPAQNGGAPRGEGGGAGVRRGLVRPDPKSNHPRRPVRAGAGRLRCPGPPRDYIDSHPTPGRRSSSRSRSRACASPEGERPRPMHAHGSRTTGSSTSSIACSKRIASRRDPARPGGTGVTWRSRRSEATPRSCRSPRRPRASASPICCRRHGDGAEAFRLPLSVGDWPIRAGWLTLHQLTGAPVLPLLPHR